MLSDSDKQLLLLTISSDYTYNKAIAIVDKNNNSKRLVCVLTIKGALKLGMKSRHL